MRNKQKTVIVLGAPRSGTSVTTGILDILGVDVGDVRPPDETNPKGYFEDIEVSKLIKEIFDLAGGDGINPPDRGKLLAQKNKIDNKIRKFCHERLRSKEIWGWKVPGTNLTIELFLPYLVNPHFVVVFRNPLGVANSMVKRRKLRDKKEMSLLEALNLTNFYDKEIVSFLERMPDLPCTFVVYEELMSDPIKEAKSLAEFLGLNLTGEKKKKINKFVMPVDRIDMEKRKAAVRRLFMIRVPRFTSKLLKNPPKAPRYIYLTLKKNLLRNKITNG